MNVLAESMTRVEVDFENPKYRIPVKWVVRCWRQEAKHNINAEGPEKIMAVIQGFPRGNVNDPETFFWDPAPGDLAKLLLGIDRMNAVEVIDIFGNGVVLYKDWP